MKDKVFEKEDGVISHQGGLPAEVSMYKETI